jgi:undecaprenyl-diphosphatase
VNGVPNDTEKAQTNTESVTHLAHAPTSVRETVMGVVLSAGMALAVGSLIFFTWLTDEVFEGSTAAFDDTVRNYVHTFARAWLTTLMIWISFLGSTIFLTAASAAAVLIFVFVKRWHSAIIMAATMIGASILNYVLKETFHRARPIPYFDLPAPVSFSFPSGHALCSACFYGILCWLLASRMEGRGKKFAFWLAAMTMSGLIGLSRVYLGVHFASDVLAGYAAAAVWLSAVVLADSFFRIRRSRKAG